MTINEKIRSLRKKMKEYNIDACIISNSDPHHNEYLPDLWKYCEWLSGFSGSSATIVITAKEAGLWTDSRYFLIAENVLKKTLIKLFKLNIPGVCSPKEWLLKKFNNSAVVGIYGGMVPLSEIRALEKYFKDSSIKLRTDLDLVSKIWKERPGLPKDKIFIFNKKYAGRSRKEKIKDLRKIMKEKKVQYHLTPDLTEIAWLLNIRGSDILHLPVAFAYILISLKKLYLFINPHKVDPTTKKELTADGVTLQKYSELILKLKTIPKSSTILLNPKAGNQFIFKNCSHCNIKEAPNIITPLKAVKNNIQIRHLRNSSQKDGVAMVKFFTWFYKRLGKEKITELSSAKKLSGFRGEQKLYWQDAFSPIVAYNKHAASAHYSPEEGSDTKIEKKGILLIDSGGAYLDGATDTTRVIPLGKISSKQKKDYTLVLKGVISLSLANFPKGSSGGYLDSLAREPMWKHGRNFMHMTGHGIGFFLNVHEGPQGFGGNSKTSIEPGMVTTVEPGIYRPGKYGIRIENMVLCIKERETEIGIFYGFETLTVVPINTKMIDKRMLTNEEVI